MKKYFLRLVWDKAVMIVNDYNKVKVCNKVKVYNKVKHQRAI